MRVRDDVNVDDVGVGRPLVARLREIKDQTLKIKDLAIGDPNHSYELIVEWKIKDQSRGRKEILFNSVCRIRKPTDQNQGSTRDQRSKITYIPGAGRWRRSGARPNDEREKEEQHRERSKINDN